VKKNGEQCDRTYEEKTNTKRLKIEGSKWWYMTLVIVLKVLGCASSYSLKKSNVFYLKNALLIYLYKNGFESNKKMLGLLSHSGTNCCWPVSMVIYYHTRYFHIAWVQGKWILNFRTPAYYGKNYIQQNYLFSI
jgi:hypothetical protein